MVDPKQLDRLAGRMAGTVPGAQALKDDLEKTFRGLLQSAFAKLDLVTREEFEVQSQVLARTRARLEALEAQVAELEKEVLPDHKD